tara:strand:+ start:1264 stop:1569 length:306 start_codon:yes stop_codon:yes gene_type:complete
MKEPDALKTIGEVAKALKVPSHVIRFWEKKFFLLSPIQKNKGRRYYSLEDVELLNKIKRLLYEEHYSIKGAQKLLSKTKKIEEDNLLIEIKSLQKKIKDLI